MSVQKRRVVSTCAAWVCLLGFLGTASGQGKTIPLPAGTRLTIPAHAGASVKWVLPVNLKVKADANPIFGVDTNGLPWFSYAGKVLANPLKGFAAEVAPPYSDLAWLDTGDLVLCANGSIGVLRTDVAPSPQTGGGLPMLRFEPVLALPPGTFRLFPGCGGTLYLVGRQASSNDVYVLERHGANGSIRKLLVTDTSVDAVAGDGVRTYLASGRSVAQVDFVRGRLSGVFTHATEDIRQIAYSPSAGLFYATDTHVGTLSPKGHPLEFLATVRPQIVLRGNALFVMLGNSCAVLKIDRADALAKLGTAQSQTPQPRP